MGAAKVGGVAPGAGNDRGNGRGRGGKGRGGGNQLSEYEQLRASKMKENNEYLASLNLAPIAAKETKKRGKS